MDEEESHWVPVYFENGVTIGEGKVTPDGRYLMIKLNEGSEIGKLIEENLLGINTFSIATNDAQEDSEIKEEHVRINLPES